MKTKSLLLLLLLAGKLLVAQTRTVVYGTIINPKDRDVKVTYTLGDEEKSATAKLDANNKFKIVLKLKSPKSGYFMHGDEGTPMFLQPGDSIQLSLDTKQFDETIRYAGKGAETNNYLAKRFLHFESTIEAPDFFQQHARKYAFSDEDVFVKYIDSLEEVKLSYLNQHKNTLPPLAYDYLYAEIVYKAANEKVDYPTMHYYLLDIDDSVVQVKPEYYSFFKRLPVDNENYLSSYEFGSYVESYIVNKAELRYGKGAFTNADQITIIKEELKGNIQEQLLYAVMMRTLNYGRAGEIDSVYVLCKSDIQDETYRTTIDAKYKRIQSLMPGKKAPEIKAQTATGQQVSLSSYKGKVVYIDFWASWCGPCRKEMPASRALQDSFAKADVVFLFVSIDEEAADWKRAMEKEKLKGVHVRVKGFDHAIPDSYNVTGIPHYCLVGRDGNIISNNASRPSDDEVYEEIRKALGK